MSGSGLTYMTLDNLSDLTGAEAKNLLQLKYEPTHFGTFSTQPLLEELQIPVDAETHHRYPNQSRAHSLTMTKTEEIKNKYAEEVRALLSAHLDACAAFDKRWQDEKYREAYLYVDEAVKTLGIKPSTVFRKADEDFYWEFIN